MAVDASTVPPPRRSTDPPTPVGALAVDTDPPGVTRVVRRDLLCFVCYLNTGVAMDVCEPGKDPIPLKGCSTCRTGLCAEPDWDRA